MNKDSTVQKSGIPVYARVIAAILAVLLIGNIMLISFVRVDYSPETYSAETDTMAQYIARTDEYINKGLAYRLRSALSIMGSPDSFEDYYTGASVAIADNDLTKAADYLDKAIDLFEGEDSVLALLNMKQGCVLAMSNRWGSAQKYFEAAVKLDSSSADAWLMLAQTEYKNEQYPDAIIALTEYSKRGEMDYEKYELLASMQFLNKNYEDAIESFSMAMEQEGCSMGEAYYLRSKAYYLLGAYDDCRRDAQSAIDAGYDYSESMLMKGAAYESEKDYEGVLTVLLEMIDNGIEDESVYQNALTCAVETNNYEAQEKIILRLLEYDTDTETDYTLRTSLAMAQLQNEKFEESKDNLEICIETHPENAELIYLHGICLLNLSQYQDAFSDFTKVIGMGEMVEECHYNRALCQIATGYSDDAQIELQGIINRNAGEKMVALAKQLIN